MSERKGETSQLKGENGLWVGNRTYLKNVGGFKYMRVNQEAVCIM